MSNQDPLKPGPISITEEVSKIFLLTNIKKLIIDSIKRPFKKKKNEN